MDGWMDRVLTLHVFLLWGGLLVRGGLAHRPGHLGARQTVLCRGDAVRQRLTRHLPSEKDRAQLSGVRDGPTPPPPPPTHRPAPKRPRRSQVVPAAPPPRPQRKHTGEETLFVAPSRITQTSDPAALLEQL